METKNEILEQDKRSNNEATDEKQMLDDLFSDVEELDFIEINEATALPETAATSGSNITGCSTCGSSSTCTSST